MKEELKIILNDFKQAIELLALRIDALEEHQKINEEVVKEIEKNIIENIYEPAQASLNAFTQEQALKGFRDKYGERFAPYEESIRLIEDDREFDPVIATYDELEKRKAIAKEEGVEIDEAQEEEFVNQVIEGIKADLESLKGKLDAVELEVKVDADGDVKVIATDEAGNKELVDDDKLTEDIASEVVEEYGKELPRFITVE